jgi:hypothetical protein
MQHHNKGDSDHTTVLLKIHINTLSFKMQEKKLITKTDWEKIMGDETTNATYNETRKHLNELTATEDNTPIEYTDFFKNIKRADTQTATKLMGPRGARCTASTSTAGRLRDSYCSQI